MIYHEFSSGERVADIAGHIVRQDEVPAIYFILDRIDPDHKKSETEDVCYE